MTARVPVFISEDSRYFTDPYQGLPSNGYTAMFDAILDHPLITVRTEVDARAELDFSTEGVIGFGGKPFEGTVIYTGPLDELFGYRFGRLPYRSLDFVFETHEIDQFQPRGTINYTVSEDYTGSPSSSTSPVSRSPTNHHRAGVQQGLRSRRRDGSVLPRGQPDGAVDARGLRRVGLGAAVVPDPGRLAEYRYYNMDATVANALELADRLLEEAR